MKYEENKCPTCKHSRKLRLYFSDINDKLQPYESEKVYIGYCPMIDDNVDETDWCLNWESEPFMDNEQQRKQEIADKVHKTLGHTNYPMRWNIIFGYDCIQIELDKENPVPLFSDTIYKLEKELDNYTTTIETKNGGNIFLFYDVGVIDENIDSNEVWEYSYDKLIKKEIME